VEETPVAARNRFEDAGRAATRVLSTPRPMERLREKAGVLERWAFDAALPLWWSNGADHANGGFEDLLDLEGRPVRVARRARVQARQIHVYATAGAMGWDGPWRAAIDHGLDYFIGRYFRSDGLVRASVSATGAPADEGPLLYDQAFGLLALAAAGVETADRARALIGAIDGRFRCDDLGYRSGDPARPYQSNPQMHLFEASLAWMARDPSTLWSDLAKRMADLAMTRLVDASTGALREFFDGGWAPAAGVDGTIVEPGHQFEWAWLLYRWGRMSGDATATGVADRLYEIGAVHGVDRTREVAINALDDRFGPLDRSARLWPQTEWIKAALLAAEFAPGDSDRHLSRAVEGIAGLERYLLPNGTWRDTLKADGAFVEEPAPASSLYHIIGAIAEVARAAKSGTANAATLVDP
jgi:mannose-1-phosphate guanylyltransferase/mannose-6-phosphate isomerase